MPLATVAEGRKSPGQNASTPPRSLMSPPPNDLGRVKSMRRHLNRADPTTLELLGLLVEQIPTTAIATLLTCRPHFQPAWHHRSYITEMTLNHLSHTQVEPIVTCITDGKTLPQEVLVQIVAKTDGVPLFVEELTKAILDV